MNANVLGSCRHRFIGPKHFIANIFPFYFCIKIFSYKIKMDSIFKQRSLKTPNLRSKWNSV